MVMRETMWKKKKKNFGGEFPDYGAIFMSNRATLHECLRSKLFGLPNSYSHFVKQVRSGMILFLFEYEERRLHGVFQACSDGEMNIVTYAYKKASGRLFPAQVRFIRIWDCYPLGESEFRDAIEDNYYETYKFNFGLSQYQVNRLLWLFNSKKMVVGTSKILSCRRKREPDYEFEDGEVETERSPFRKTFSSGISVVICNESESSPLDYTANVCGSSLSESQVSELSCSSGGCKAASNDIGSGSETIISEKGPESLEDSSKDVGTDDLGDFIPLSSPDNSECVVDCVSNDQTEFASSLKQFFPLALLNAEDLGKKNIDVEFAAPRLDGLPLDALPCPSPRTGDCPSNEGTCNSLDVKPLYSDAQEKRSSVFSRLNFSSKDIGEDKNASGDEDSEYNLLPKGEEKEITRGNDRVQDIMDSLVQTHNSWNKFKPKNVFLKQEVVDSGVRKNVFSRLSSE